MASPSICKRLLVLETFVGSKRALLVPLQIKACHNGHHSLEEKAGGRCLCEHLGHKIRRVKQQVGTITLRPDPEEKRWYTNGYLAVKCECGQHLAVFTVEVEVATCE